ncbi:hypothetical protein Q5P01_019031 [Channa striata]|uniref:Ig-like domain-containing protein n=1 Tax=Channa striata TaxID=64152 RepID=A0AA88S6D3_CHASR|nr:hypothetical protein Q5P01_019031 [Channa striata]
MSVSECGSSTIVARTGQNVTLLCKYDIKRYEERSICWSRGEIPYLGCSNQLIATGNYKVQEQTSDSSKYQLLGRLDEGDVSLTILNLTETDAGRYGCRVDIPGWFNDEKHHFDLTIEKGYSVEVTSAGLTPETEDEVPTTAALSHVQQQQQQEDEEEQKDDEEEVIREHIFITNLVRLSLIVFVPGVLLAAAYKRVTAAVVTHRTSAAVYFSVVCAMTLSVFIMTIVLLLLLLLTVSECGSSTIVARTGQNVTLLCKYDIKRYEERSICWSRGELSSRGCINQLIATGNYKVQEQTSDSSKYQLLGRLDEGDVSLTILNLTETDAGRYGCRVDIPGWFNDEKHHFDLTFEEASATTTSSENVTQTSTEQTSAAQTAVPPAAGQMTSTASLSTSSSSKAQESSSNLTVVLVCVLFGLVALVTVGGVVIMAKRWKEVIKVPRRQVNGTVRFSSTSSTLQLHHRISAVENIYQIDGGGVGGEYEYCP